MSAHGYGPYTNGCRCDFCRAAKATYQRAKRAAAGGRARLAAAHGGRLLVDGVTHGTAAAYLDCGCRCAPCTRAATAKRNREVQRRAARAVAR